MSRSAWRRGKRRRVAVLARSEMHCTGSREACMGQVHKPSVGLTVGRAAPPRLLCSLVEVPNGLGADGLAALNRLGELAMTPGHRPEAPTSDALDNELGAAICRVGCVPPVTRRPLVVRPVGAAFVWVLVCSYIPEELVGDWNLGHLVTLRLAFVGTKDIDPAWFGIERIVLPVDGRIGEVDPKTDVERSGPTLVCQVGLSDPKRPAGDVLRPPSCMFVANHDRSFPALVNPVSEGGDADTDDTHSPDGVPEVGSK